jgi:F-type H+-transporting ATPase subunit a
LIRQGTLAVRLTANITAGHLLLTPLRNNGPSLNYSLLRVLTVAQIALLILESAVAIIQSSVRLPSRFISENNPRIWNQFEITIKGVD